MNFIVQIYFNTKIDDINEEQKYQGFIFLKNCLLSNFNFCLKFVIIFLIADLKI